MNIYIPENGIKEKELRATCKKYHIKLIHSYYEYELNGAQANLEKVTKELWSMPADEWWDNGFLASDYTRKHKEGEIC